MNKTLWGLLLILVTGGVVGFMISTTPPEKNPGIQETASFEDTDMGIAFKYPNEWSGQVVKDDKEMVLFFDSECVKGCNNLYVKQLTEKINDEAFFNTLAGEFKLKDFESKAKPEALEFYKSNPKAYSSPKEEDGMLFIQGLDPSTSIPTLKIYDNKTTIFIFEIKTPPSEDGTPNFKILKNDQTDLMMQSEKVFDAISGSFRDLRTESDKEEVDEIFPAALNSGPEYRFSSCDDIKSYEKETFYADFVKKLEGLDLYTTPKAISDFGFVKAKIENVIGACHSVEGNMLLTIVSPKEYCELGNVAKYDIAAGTLTYAENTRAQVPCVSLQTFGKRTGTVIEVKGAHGDAGSITNALFQYGYNQNILQVKQTCSGSSENADQLDCKTY